MNCSFNIQRIFSHWYCLIFLFLVLSRNLKECLFLIYKQFSALIFQEFSMQLEKQIDLTLLIWSNIHLSLCLCALSCVSIPFSLSLSLSTSLYCLLILSHKHNYEICAKFLRYFIKKFLFSLSSPQAASPKSLTPLSPTLSFLVHFLLLSTTHTEINQAAQYGRGPAAVAISRCRNDSANRC